MAESSIKFLTLAYSWGWVTIAQLQAAVLTKTLTAAEYKQITGTDYTPEAT